MGLEVKVDIDRMIEDGKYKALKEILQYLEPADIVDLMEDLDPSKKIVIFRLLPKELAAQVFSEMEIEDQKKLISLFKEERLKSILEELDPDDRTILFEELPANVVRKLLLYLPADERKKALELLNYPPDSAGRLMTPEFVDLYIDMTVKEAMERIKRIAPEKETIYTCYVIDKTRKLLGVVELKDLILADENTKIGDLMNERVVFVRTTDDQEKVVQLMKKYDLIAIPVVDSEDRLVGIVTIDDVLDVMEEETDEDIQRMFAVQRVEAPYLRT
ncbi:MAG: magnesium transporter, partial [Thermotogae bacterium]|nr:magnesium transporter [Thermotogota bacterium]